VDPSGLACSALPGGSVAGRIVLVQRGTCTFASKLNNAAAGGALAIVVYNIAGGDSFSSVGASVGSASLPALFVDQADGAALKAQAGRQVSLDFTGATPFPARPDVTYFSSRGPSVGSAPKPDLAAVGEEIVTGAQHTYTGGESYSASGFIDTAGTSFSTPLAAGAAAVLKAARPGLTGQQYRSLLINSASPATVSDGVDATISQAGAGILNLAAAINGTAAAYPTSLNLGTGAALHGSAQLTLWNVGSASDIVAEHIVEETHDILDELLVLVPLVPCFDVERRQAADRGAIGAEMVAARRERDFRAEVRRRDFEAEIAVMLGHRLVHRVDEDDVGLARREAGLDQLLE
jgi:subtilisin family serine protease